MPVTVQRNLGLRRAKPSMKNSTYLTFYLKYTGRAFKCLATRIPSFANLGSCCFYELDLVPFPCEPMANVIGQWCKAAAMAHASETSLLKGAIYGDGGGPGPEKRAEKVVAPVRLRISSLSLHLHLIPPLKPQDASLWSLR